MKFQGRVGGTQTTTEDLAFDRVIAFIVLACLVAVILSA